MKSKHEYRALVECRETRYCTVTAGSEQEAIELIENEVASSADFHDQLSRQYMVKEIEQRE